MGIYTLFNAEWKVFGIMEGKKGEMNILKIY